MAQARQPYFYAVLGVPDTPEGRFELIVLHLSLLIDRLRDLEGSQAPFAKVLTGVFVTDVYDTYRERGVGDMSVPRHVKKAAGVLYDRTLECRALVEADDQDGLAAAMAQHLEIGDPQSASRLASYHGAARALLLDQSLENLHAGRVTFPDPAQV